MQLVLRSSGGNQSEVGPLVVQRIGRKIADLVIEVRFLARGDSNTNILMHTNDTNGY